MSKILLDLNKLHDSLEEQGIKELTSTFQGEAYQRFDRIIEQINKREQDHYFLNNIFISGNRGSGKTYFLETIPKYLAKNNNYLFFKTIDPTLLHDNESFLTIIIAQILNHIKTEAPNKFQDDKNLFDLITKLSQSIEATLPDKMEKISVLQMIGNDQQGLDIPKKLNEFLQYIAKEFKVDKLVFLIDDVDMAFEKGYEVLEVIRRYLASKYLIIIITGDIDLYEKVLIKMFTDKFSVATEVIDCAPINIKVTDNNAPVNIDVQKSENINFDFQRKLANDYLTKLLPCNNRIKIKNIDDYSDDLEGEDSLRGLDKIIIKKKQKEISLEKCFSNFVKNFHLEHSTLVTLKQLSLRKLLQVLEGEFEWFFEVKKQNEDEDLNLTYEALKNIDFQYYLSLSKKRSHYIYFSYFNRGKMYSKEQEFKQALEEFKKAYGQAKRINLSDNAILKTIENLGEAYLQDCNFYEAIQISKEALKIDSDNFQNQLNLARAYEELNPELAIDTYRSILEKHHTRYDIYLKLGHLLSSTFNLYSEAIPNFKRAIQLRPEHALSYYGLGYAQAKLNQFENAKQNFIKVIKLNPEYQEAYREIAILLLSEKNYSKAAENLLIALKLNSKDSQSLFHLGFLFYKQEKYKKAIEQFEKIDDDSIDYIQSLFYRGVCYFELKQYKNCSYWMKKCLKKKSDYYNAYLYLAKVAINEKNLEIAIECSKVSLVLFTEQTNAQTELNEYIIYMEISFLLKQPIKKFISLTNMKHFKENNPTLEIMEKAFEILEGKKNLEKQLRQWEEEYVQLTMKLDFNFEFSLEWLTLEYKKLKETKTENERKKEADKLLNLLEKFNKIILSLTLISYAQK